LYIEQETTKMDLPKMDRNAYREQMRTEVDRAFDAADGVPTGVAQG